MNTRLMDFSLSCSLKFFFYLWCNWWKILFLWKYWGWGEEITNKFKGHKIPKTNPFLIYKGHHKVTVLPGAQVNKGTFLSFVGAQILKLRNSNDKSCAAPDMSRLDLLPWSHFTAKSIQCPLHRSVVQVIYF